MGGQAAPDALDLLRLLHEALAAGRSAVLVTMTRRDGASPRSLGTHMVVLDDGSFAGSLSGGCLEAAIAAEALDVLRQGGARIVRYGEGSRYIDLRLPCGGAMDILFTPDPPQRAVASAIAVLEARRPVALTLTRDGGFASGEGNGGTGWNGDFFVVTHRPRLRIVAAGSGPELVVLTRLAACYGADVELWSPDRALVDSQAKARHLLTPSSSFAADCDPDTAIVLLFHDHEWDCAMLSAALRTPAFWIGAMGSRRTQAARGTALAAEGWTEQDIARVRGPIGLIPSGRDPSTIALSALAEIVAAHRAAGDPCSSMSSISAGSMGISEA